jgi:uncharacterized phage-associated protein
MEHPCLASDRPTGMRTASPQAVADVRAIANIVLARASQLKLPVSNMALNKIVYFIHCDHLLERGEPLVRAKIEAWKHGPVFRELYHQFKAFEDRAISSQATKVDAETGEVVVAEAELSQQDKAYVVELIDRYVRFSAAQLRAISHLPGGPWHAVWGHDGEANPGMQITNELILINYSPLERQ